MKGSTHLRRSWLALAGLAVMFLLLGVPAAHSQTATTGDIVGVVTDSSGAVVPNAKVTIKFTDTNESHSAVTSPSGQYRFALLQAGEYFVSGEATGLKSKIEKFTLFAGHETAINLTIPLKGTNAVAGRRRRYHHHRLHRARDHPRQGLRRFRHQRPSRSHKPIPPQWLRRHGPLPQHQQLRRQQQPARRQRGSRGIRDRQRL